MELNFVAIGVAVVAQFIIGAVWYSALFGKLWAKIHGFDALSPEAQKEAQSKMWPLLVIQFGLTIVTTVVLALLKGGLPPEWNIYGLSVFIWLGFVMPAQVSAVLFGGTEPKWIVKKIAIASGASLMCYLAAALCLQLL
jgi:Protein of unknown function (DUF1761)